jgi:hypothetical protein
MLVLSQILASIEYVIQKESNQVLRKENVLLLVMYRIYVVKD